MKLRLIVVGSAMALATASFAGPATVAVYNVGDLGANDFIAWDQFGSDFSQIASGTHGFTNNGIGFTFYSANDFTGQDDGGSGEVRTEGVSWDGIFNGGDRLLYFHNSFAQTQSDIALVFDKAVGGVGANIQSNAFGNYTANMGAWDGALGGNALAFGAVDGNNTGLEDGTAPFMGAVGGMIRTVYYSFHMKDGSDDLGAGMANVLVNDNAVPEPASMAALGIGFVALLRRRAKK